MYVRHMDQALTNYTLVVNNALFIINIIRHHVRKLSFAHKRLTNHRSSMVFTTEKISAKLDFK